MKTRKISAADTYELRQKVLRPFHSLLDCHFPKDEESVHFGVFDGDKIISIVTAHPENSPLFQEPMQWRIRGMATDPEYQGKGAGTLALKALLNWGKDIPLFWCNARVGAIPFYLKHKYQIASELFDIPGVGPHKIMWVKP